MTEPSRSDADPLGLDLVNDRRARPRCRGDRGEVSSAVVMMPVALLLILLMVQTALAWHARTVLEGAASDALVATQIDGGTIADGEDAAHALLSGSSDNLLTEIDVAVERQLDVTSVTIEARVTNVIPLLPIRVRAHAAGQTERFRSETDPP